MIVIKTDKNSLKESVVKHLECEDCRKSITTPYIYSIQLTPNKNNGKGILLCEKCTKDLQFELNKNL